MATAMATVTQRAMVWNRAMARTARAIAMAMRVVGNKLGKGTKGNGDSGKGGGRQQREQYGQQQE